MLGAASLSGIAPAREELRRDEHLVARDAALAQRPSDACLVAVCLRGVDVAVSQLQRRAHGLNALRSVGDLPYAEPEQRHHRPVGEHPTAAVGGSRPLLDRSQACSNCRAEARASPHDLDQPLDHSGRLSRWRITTERIAWSCNGSSAVIQRISAELWTTLAASWISEQSRAQSGASVSQGRSSTRA